MNTKRQIAQDLLASIKSNEAQLITSHNPSAEYAELHKKHEAHVGVSGANPEKVFEDIFATWLEKVASVLPEPARSEIPQRIVVGCMDHLTVNAFISPSDDGECFAIVINRALLTMVNHYVKLEAATIYPDSVIYSEILPPEMMSPVLYNLKRSNMLKDYGRTGLPYGPKLKFALESEALRFVDTTLQLMQLFVLGHELGHYLNGDLGVLANFAKFSSAPRFLVFGEGVSHDIEFKADKVAFDIVLRVLNLNQPELPARRALALSVVLFFNFLGEISNNGSESHPRPTDRLVAITREFFGPEAAELMQKTFDDKAAIDEFKRRFGKQTVAELLKSRR